MKGLIKKLFKKNLVEELIEDARIKGSLTGIFYWSQTGKLIIYLNPTSKRDRELENYIRERVNELSKNYFIVDYILDYKSREELEKRKETSNLFRERLCII